MSTSMAILLAALTLLVCTTALIITVLVWARRLDRAVPAISARMTVRRRIDPEEEAVYQEELREVMDGLAAELLAEGRQVDASAVEREARALLDSAYARREDG